MDAREHTYYSTNGNAGTNGYPCAVGNVERYSDHLYAVSAQQSAKHSSDANTVTASCGHGDLGVKAQLDRHVQTIFRYLFA